MKKRVYVILFLLSFLFLIIGLVISEEPTSGGGGGGSGSVTIPDSTSGSEGSTNVSVPSYGGGGGSGGSSSQYATYEISLSQLEAGYTQSLHPGDRISFQIGNYNEYVKRMFLLVYYEKCLLQYLNILVLLLILEIPQTQNHHLKN